MYTKKTEIKVLQNALEAFEKTTELTAELELGELTFDAARHADALIRIIWQDMEWYFVAEVKNTLTRATLGGAVHQLHKLPEKGLLVTTHVTPQLAEQLKEMDIPFIDTVGNAYINEPPLFIFIKGNRHPLPYRGERPARAFQPTGLQVIFAILCNPGLENAPFRDIAKLAKVALGTVGWVMRDLKQMGFLIDMGRRGRHLIRKKDLLTQWVTAYPERLRPKLLVERYHATNFDWWRDARLDNFQAFWGGEIAAAMLTKYLKPHIVTIYTNEPFGEFLLRHRIKKNPDGDIEILRVFWEFRHDWAHHNLVHPLLVYADLLATGDPRNIETAEIIYEQQLPRFIWED